jgi:thiosulfate/3-mercaptopyruvate sulfurtransferase
VVVLHVASSRGEYDAGHVPGARYLPFTLVGPALNGLTLQVPEVGAIDSLLESVGVNDDQRVILYGQPLQVARTFMTMEHVGLRGKVSVLDGSIDTWRESGRVVSMESVTPRPGKFTPRLANNVADVAWIQANSASKGVALLDARAPEFYLGFSAGAMPRAGHIPNARNIPYSSLTGELSQFRDEGKVRRLFEAAGVAKGDTVVTYCHIGLQASLLYFTARRLGYEAKVYDGSFEEWSKKPELPIVTRKQ